MRPLAQIRFCFSLHPYLLKNLKRLKLHPLTSLQQQILDITQQQQIDQKKDKENTAIMINENTGTGKTLCYLLPIMDAVLKRKREVGKPWGALVLTLTKQLCLQTYRQVRLLDPDNLIKVSRIGSISHFSGIVQKLNKKQTSSSDNLDELVKQNVINTINWNNWDILISTPHALLQAVNKQKQLINPQIVAIDEADMLMVLDQNVAFATKQIIKKYVPKNADYLLATSSFPLKIKGVQSQKVLKGIFNKLTILDSPTKHKLPPSLKVQFVDTALLKDDTKQNVLLSLLPRTDSNIKTIVFCNSAQSVNSVQKQLTKNGFKSQALSAPMSTQIRTSNLSQFQSSQSQILVTTNLASRGLDLNVGLVIQYEMATNVVDYINRAGRTARFGKQGTIISFVQEGNKLLFQNIKQRLQSGQAMQDIFSRKRSLSKNYKKGQREQ